jgi:gluconate 2-dehydrogenase gamma chain
VSLPSRLSRRGFLAAAGSAAAAWLAFESRDLLAAGRHAAEAQAFEYLSPRDAADIEAASSEIIPSDATPGAREARVVYFIDRTLATFGKDQREVFQKGVKELRTRAAKRRPGTTSFAALPPADRTAVIASLEKDKHPFFDALRGATIAGMFANPEYGGNHDKVGWKLIGFDDRFSWGAPFGWYDRNA